MAPQSLQLDADPARALAEIRNASADHPVLIFKKSPICPVSHRAEAQYVQWKEALGAADDILVADIDVIAEKPLARGLTKQLGIDHQSPQALWFVKGELAWHGSHAELTLARFDELKSSAQ